MTHIVNLLYGDDRRVPDRELNLNSIGGDFTLAEDNNLLPGAVNLLESGQSIRFDGQRVVSKSRDNMRFTWRFVVSASSAAEFSNLVRQVLRFAEEARRNVNGEAEAVWLEYRWNTSSDLDNLPRPTWGQLNYYARVLDIEASWPDTVLRDVVSGVVEGLELTFVCEPYWYGLEQRALTGAGAIDLTYDFGTTLSGLDFSGVFTISGWVRHVNSSVDYSAAFVYYIDDNNYLRVFIDKSTNRVYLQRNVAGTITSANVLLTDVKQVFHFAVTQSASAITCYINGTAMSTTLAVNAWGAGTLRAGWVVNSGGFSSNTSALDAYRVWTGDTLTAAEIAALYAEEKTVKDAGDWIGKPPYQAPLTSYTLLGNIGGDAPALTRNTITTTAATLSPIYTGTNVNDAVIAPSGINYVTTTTTATFGTSPQQKDILTTTTVNNHRGVWSIFTRAYASGATDTITVKPFWYTAYSDSKQLGTFATTLTTTNTMYYLGDLIIDWPDTAPATIYVGVMVYSTGTTNTATIGPFLMLQRSVKLSTGTAIPTSQTLQLDRRRARVTSGTSSRPLMAFYGDEVTLAPNRYNYLYLLQNSSGTPFDTWDAIYVTPRWRLAGGLAG